MKKILLICSCLLLTSLSAYTADLIQTGQNECLDSSSNLYPSLNIPYERLNEMRAAWIYGGKKCTELMNSDPKFWENYGRFYTCQGTYLEKFGKDFEKLYQYCTAASMAKYTKCMENVLDIR